MKTKKNKRIYNNRKYKSRSYRSCRSCRSNTYRSNKYNIKWGGTLPLKESNDANDANDANEIMNEIKEGRKSHLLNDSINLTTKMTSNLLQNISSKLGIDLTDSNDVHNYLNKINIAINDPKNKEKLKEIIRNSAENAKDVLEAASPFIEPLINKTIEEGEKAASKIAQSAVKIGLNTAEEIPGAGIIIGTIRSLNNAGEALLATSSAASEIMTSASDTVNATLTNLKRIREEKEKLVQKTLNKNTTPTANI